MLPMGYWFVATLISEKDKGTFDFDWSFVAVPHKEEVPAGASFGSPTATAININSDDKDLAWEYIAWRCGEEGALAHAEVGTRPAYVSDAVAAKLSEAPGFPADEAAKAALIPTTMGIEWPTGDKVPAIKTIVNEEHSLIMVRDVSIEDGIASMTERVAEVLAAE
jgi:multiple sugar transport system substrate-binding protein